MDATFSASYELSPLSAPEWAELREQHATAASLVKKHTSGALSDHRSDLALAQKLIDSGKIDVDMPNHVDALAAVLGNVFVKELDFEWTGAEARGERLFAVRLKTAMSLVVVPRDLIKHQLRTEDAIKLEPLYAQVLADSKARRVF